MSVVRENARPAVDIEPTPTNNVVPLDRPRAESKGEVKPEGARSNEQIPENEQIPTNEQIPANEQAPATQEPAARAPAAKTAPDAPAADKAAAPPAKKRSKARILLPILLIAGLGGGGWYGYDYWTN